MTEPGLAVAVLQGDTREHHTVGDKGIGAAEIEGMLGDLVEHGPGLRQLIAFVQHQRMEDVQRRLGTYPASFQHRGLHVAGSLKAGEGGMAMAQGQLQ
ncbi:hypothetical protein D3C81_1464650 [compost metagenome]